MPVHPENKYHLKDVYQEIDYLDRKIAYAQTLEKFATEADREAALKKLATSRDRLVKAANDLTAKGVEFDAKDLPRSFTKPASPDSDEATPASTETAQS